MNDIKYRGVSHPPRKLQLHAAYVPRSVCAERVTLISYNITIVNDFVRFVKGFCKEVSARVDLSPLHAQLRTPCGQFSRQTSGTGSLDETQSTRYTNSRDNDNDYLGHTVGYSGQSASKSLMEYRKTFLNIDMMIIDELESLFFGLF